MPVAQKQASETEGIRSTPFVRLAKNKEKKRHVEQTNLTSFKAVLPPADRLLRVSQAACPIREYAPPEKSSTCQGRGRLDPPGRMRALYSKSQ